MTVLRCISLTGNSQKISISTVKAFETRQLLIHVYTSLHSCMRIKNVYGRFGLKTSIYILLFWECFGVHNASKMPSIKYVINWGKDGSFKMYITAYSECLVPCVRTQLYPFSCFWQHACLMVSCIICRILT